MDLLDTRQEATALSTRNGWPQPRRDDFWRQIPAWKDISEDSFLSWRWQERNAITQPGQLAAALDDLVSPEFIADLEASYERTPMATRVSPYLIALVDWSAPLSDPIRRQFLPLRSQQEPNHPMATLDPLQEQIDSPVPGLTHRYPDRALFLALDTCPVYCRFCTRSYAVGNDTTDVTKARFPINDSRWEEALQYIATQPNLTDIVVSGGDAYRLKPDQLRALGHRLLDIQHIQRFRIATKGPAVQPMKLITDKDWVGALFEIVERGRRLHKEVCVHTHFNHPNEITGITEKAMSIFVERGITVRNQSVLQRGVNDDPDVVIELCRRLGAMHVESYYMYLHDLVVGAEDLRTPIDSGMEIEKHIRGATSGFNTPLFVVDLPGGGGKRDVYSFEHYDRETGISVYTAPSVKPGQFFTCFDPMRDLRPDVCAAWQDPGTRMGMIEDAMTAARRKL